MWKCKTCGKTFPLPARISCERTSPNPFTISTQATRIIVEKPCCPFCESIEFEEVKERQKHEMP